VWLRQQRQVCILDLVKGNVGFSHDAAETGVGVLQVWAGVTFEGGHSVHFKFIVVDTIGH